MAVDFQKVRQQIKELGKNAPQREKELRDLRNIAEGLLTRNAPNKEYLQDKIQRAAHLNRFLRCAIPTDEELIETFPLPTRPEIATIFAVDGSQINPDRHERVEYCLINIGIFQMHYGSAETPQPIIKTEMYYGDNIYTPKGIFTNEIVALIRDRREREVLADLADQTEGKVLTITDGPIELWGNENENSVHFDKYLAALSRLHKRGAITAGYVDKPRSNLVLRLLELAALEDNRLAEAGKDNWLRGISDIELFGSKLRPGERTAIFGIQNSAASKYNEETKLHFFYLNLSLNEKPYLARVEVPAWVANDKEMLNDLHAILVEQSQIIHSPGSPYPYLLHRAHEIAVVSYEEKAQIGMMIEAELREQGVSIGPRSGKQNLKNFSAKKTKQ